MRSMDSLPLLMYILHDLGHALARRKERSLQLFGLLLDQLVHVKLSVHFDQSLNGIVCKLSGTQTERLGLV